MQVSARRTVLIAIPLLLLSIALALVRQPSGSLANLRRVLEARDPARTLLLPERAGSVRFAVFGDAGRGDTLQYETAAELTRWHEQFSFDFVLMLGDNIYGPGTPDDLVLRFARPYGALLERGVTFHAVLGNHDPPPVLTYPPLGMRGRRYYAFEKSAGLPPARTRALFVALDTLTLDGDQLSWLERTLATSAADWTIAFYHHPLYTSGQYRLHARRTRWWLEPAFVAGGVDVGFSGHEHFYERLQPQRGIQYFTSGAGGALRRGDIRPSPVLAAGFDRDTHFMLVELTGDRLHFQTISRVGQTVDAGTLSGDVERPLPRLRR